jgi:WD40 repeat protein
MGFPAISAGNASRLKTAFNLSGSRLLAAVVSADQQSILAAFSDGLARFDRQGQRLGYWPELRLFEMPCEKCLASNRDASRIAMLARAEQAWQVRVIEFPNGQPLVIKAFPLESPFRYAPNPAQLALSPDGSLLAYGPGNAAVIVVNLESGEQVFKSGSAMTDPQFSPDGSRFAARRASELLVWETGNWRQGFRNLLLPREDTPLTFSPDGQYLALALSSKIRIHDTARLRLAREFNVRPTYVNDRSWLLAFEDATTLRGYGLQWDNRAQTGRVTRAAWDILSGEEKFFEESETQSADAFAGFWGLEFKTSSLPGNLEPGEYRAIRFVGNEVLLVNGLHSACWLRLATGETKCQGKPEELIHASDVAALREVREKSNTLLNDPGGQTLFRLDAYPIYWVNRAADFLLLDVNGLTTDLYVLDSKLPVQSVPGAFRSVAENNNLLVFLTRERTELMYMTMVEKASLRALFQKRETRLFAPLALSADGTTYFLREDRDRGQAILKSIPAGGDAVVDLTRIDLSSEPVSMAVSSENTLAIGMQDGSLVIISLNALNQQTLQVLQSPVSGLVFSPDGRYLALAGREGVQVLTVMAR